MGAPAAARRDDEVTTAPEHTPTNSSIVRPVLAGVLVLALLGALAWLVVVLVRTTGEESVQAEREAVMLRAREYVKEAWNYGRADLDDQGRLTDYSERVTPLITTSFGTEFEKTVPVLQQLVAEEGFARTTTVDHLAVESIDPDSASVVVNGQITETQGDQRLSPSPFIWSLDLEQVDGTWLVADLNGYQGAR